MMTHLAILTYERPQLIAHRYTDHMLDFVTKKVKGFEKAYIVHCGFQPRLTSTLGWLPVDTT